eukprot:TRINITY_DN21230_c0_g1_i1.p1 TRINITY_DN21230_c0_g1~~TRINITY_DN21230_c0_g1_i1.p1  ORF type:complete len:780 (+),score=303.61 TRINITY_DN21230_c0_g1_i1:47-2341(+)
MPQGAGAAPPRTPPMLDVAREVFQRDGSVGSARLSEQIELNTSLLERLHYAERQQLQEQSASSGREALLAETRELLNSLNDENADLREQLAAVQEEVQGCRGQVEAARKAREVSEHDLKQLNYNLLYQMQEKNVLLQQLQQNLTEAEKRGGEEQTTVEALASKLHEATSERDAHRKGHDALFRTLSTLEEQCRTALAAAGAAPAAHLHPPSTEGTPHDKLAAVVGNLTLHVQVLEDGFRREGQRAAAGDTQNQTLKARVAAMEAACLELQEKLEAGTRSSADRTAALQRQVDESREASHGLALELLKCRQDFISAGEEADRSLDRCRQEFAVVLNELLALETGCDRAAIQLGSLQVEVAHLQGSDKATEANVLGLLKNANASLQHSEGAGQQHALDLQAAAQNLDAEKKRSAQLAKRLEMATSHGEQAQTELELLHTTLRSLQKEATTSEAATKQLHASIEQLRAQNALLATQARDAQRHVEDARDAGTQLRPLQEQIRALQQDGSAAREAQKRLEDREKRLQTALEKMANQLKKAQEVNAVLMTQRDNFKKETERLRREQDEQLQRARDKARRVLTPGRETPSAASTPCPKPAPDASRAPQHEVYSAPRPAAPAAPQHAQQQQLPPHAQQRAGASQQPQLQQPPQHQHRVAAAPLPQQPSPGARVKAPPASAPAPQQPERSAAHARAVARVAAAVGEADAGRPQDAGTPGRFPARPVPAPRDAAREEETFRQRMHELEAFNKAHEAVEASLMETLRDLQESNL